MEFRIIKLRTFSGHYYLELEIDGRKAYISPEQKPTLFSEGYIFVEPQEKWGERLPVIEHVAEKDHTMKLRGFIRSFILKPIIVEMIETAYPKRFNKKWAGKILSEDEEQVIKEQERLTAIKISKQE